MEKLDRNLWPPHLLKITTTSKGDLLVHSSFSLERRELEWRRRVNKAHPFIFRLDKLQVFSRPRLLTRGESEKKRDKWDDLSDHIPFLLRERNPILRLVSLTAAQSPKQRGIALHADRHAPQTSPGRSPVGPPRQVILGVLEADQIFSASSMSITGMSSFMG